MELSFKFKVQKAPANRTYNKKIVVRNASGVIVPDTLLNRYSVVVKLTLLQKKELNLPLNDLIVPLTIDSYDCKGKPDIWIKSKESKTGWVHIIRNEDVIHMISCPPQYIPFRPNYLARGNVVRIDGILQFKLIRCIAQQQFIDTNTHISAIINNQDE